MSEHHFRIPDGADDETVYREFSRWALSYLRRNFRWLCDADHRDVIHETFISLLDPADTVTPEITREQSLVVRLQSRARDAYRTRGKFGFTSPEKFQQLSASERDEHSEAMQLLGEHVSHFVASNSLSQIDDAILTALSKRVPDKCWTHEVVEHVKCSPKHARRRRKLVELKLVNYLEEIGWHFDGDQPVFVEPTRVSLLVEDRVRQRAHYASLLKKSGSKSVLEAASGEEALTLISEHGPGLDLLLVDAKLGLKSDVQGWQVIEAARTECEDSTIFSFSVDEECKKKCEQAGAHWFFLKPLLPEQLVVVLRRILS